MIIGTGCQVQVFSLILGSSVGLSASIQSAGHLCPFDLNIAYLCQSIEINNNKYVYRQSQVRKSTDSGVKWAECSLIIGTGCRVQVFSLISRLVSEHSICWWFGVWDPGFKSCIQQRNTTCLLSIWISLACARASKWTKQICLLPEPGAKVNWQWGQVGWMLADHKDGLSSSSY